MSDDINAIHREKMIRLNEVYERKQARAVQEKGLLIVNTGAGKGKTTAALGMAFRAMGHGLRVGIVQFIKGSIPSGELALANQLDLPIDIHALGDGFTWRTQDRERDIQTAQRAWDKAVHNSQYLLRSRGSR